MNVFEEFKQARIHNLTFLYEEYYSHLEELERPLNKYFLPVVMGICSYSEVKRMSYKEFLEISSITYLKLKKEKANLEFIVGAILSGR